jgi:hypothetical protein
VTIRRINGNTYQEVAVVAAGSSPLSVAEGLSIPEHDHITLAYTDGSLTTVTYRVGGGGGTVVATLTLGYTNGDLTTIARA